MTDLVPTGRVVEHLHGLGLSWADLHDEIEGAPRTPVPNHDDRVRVITKRVEVILAIGEYQARPAEYVLFVRRREFAALPPPKAPEPVRSQPRRRGGGSGNQWPTTFKELIALVERNKGARVLEGRKHHIVLLHGQQIAAMPKTASDHRSLMNLCRQLMKRGINVRRDGR